MAGGCQVGRATGGVGSAGDVRQQERGQQRGAGPHHAAAGPTVRRAATLGKGVPAGCAAAASILTTIVGMSRLVSQGRATLRMLLGIRFANYLIPIC